MLDVVRTDGLIQVKTDRISFALHPNSLAMELSSADGRTTLSGFLPRAVTARGVLLAEKTLADGYGEIRTRMGKATRLQIRAGLAGALELSLSVDFAEDWDGIALELALENRGDRPETVVSLDPCWWSARAGGRVALPHPPGGTWFFCMGFQSHSRSGFVPLRGRGSGMEEEDPYAAPLTPRFSRERYVSDFATQLCAPDQGGLTLGFLTHERFFNHVSLRCQGGQITELLASVPVASRVLAPRSSLASERLWLGLDAPGSDGIASWARHTALEMSVSARPGATLSWSSRHGELGRRGVFALREAVSALRDLDAGVELIEIDEGYERRLGDWLAPSDGFPEGVESVCRELETSGFQSGVWIAPFLAAADSELVRAHPDWVLREADGSPGAPFRLPGREAPCHSLDPGHPELREWLAELTRSLHRAGCRRLRLDWLSSGARSLPRAEGETTVEAYRGALRAIREAAPETPWLVGSRAPLGPSIGLVDAMRSGPDADLPWRQRGSWLRRRDAGPGAERAVANTLSRAPLGPLWQIDPDCLMMAETENPLSAIELRTVASTALLSGGLMSFSGVIRDFGAARCDLLRRLLPALGRTPEIGAPVRGCDARLVTRFPDGSALVLLPNLESRPRSFELELGPLGLQGPQHVWDAFAERSLGIVRDRWVSERVPAHGSLLLRFSPAGGRARVVGSSLHFSAGALEVSRLRACAEATVELRLRQPGRRTGAFVLMTGEGIPITAEVTFDDQIDLRVTSVPLENLAKMIDM